MNPPLGLDDLAKRLEFEVSPRRRSAFFAEATPLTIVLPGSGEAVFVKRWDAHSRLGKSGRFIVTPVRLLHVLAKGKLNTMRRGLELHRLRPMAKPQLDDCVLAADRVSRAVQQVGHGQAARKLAMYFRRLGVDDVADRDHRRRW